MISDTISLVLKEQAKKALYVSDHFRMSSLGHCPRKQVAMRAGLEPTFPANDAGLLKMWMGTTLGRDIASLLESSGFLDPSWTEREVRYKSYKGHVDGATRKLPSTDEYGPAIVELKSTADASVKNYDWPEHYEWQALGYCLGAGFSRAILYQFGREYGLDREKVVLLTPEWKQRIEDEISWMDGLWGSYQATQTLPDCKHRFKWEDKTCGYRVAKPEKAEWNPHTQTETDRELSDFLDNQENK